MSTASLLIIGNEVLSAKVCDENGPFLLRALREQGVRARELRVVGDYVPEIVQAIRDLSAHSEHVLTTGGVGPTHDDVTLEAVASALNVPLVESPALMGLLQLHFGDPVPEGPRKMGLVPEGSQVHLAADVIAPVVSARHVHVMPGIPALVRKAFPILAPQLGGRELFSATLLLAAFESDIAVSLAEIQRAHPAVEIGSYPNFVDPTHRVKLTFDGTDRDAVAAAREAARAVLATWVVG